MFSSCEVAVGESEVDGVDLQEHQPCALVAQVVLETGFDVVLNAVEMGAVEDEGGDAHHVVAVIYLYMIKIYNSF